MTLALAEGYGMIGLMMAKMRGQHWLFSHDECAKLGLASANVIKHMPVPVEQLGIGMDIAMLGVALVGVATPRVMMDQAIAEDRKQKAANALQREAQDVINQSRMGGENAMGTNFTTFVPPPPPNGQHPQPPPIETPPA